MKRSAISFIIFSVLHFAAQAHATDCADQGPGIVSDQIVLDTRTHTRVRIWPGQEACSERVTVLGADNDRSYRSRQDLALPIDRATIDRRHLLAIGVPVYIRSEVTRLLGDLRIIDGDPRPIPEGSNLASLRNIQLHRIHSVVFVGGHIKYSLEEASTQLLSREELVRDRQTIAISRDAEQDSRCYSHIAPNLRTEELRASNCHFTNGDPILLMGALYEINYDPNNHDLMTTGRFTDAHGRLFRFQSVAMNDGRAERSTFLHRIDRIALLTEAYDPRERYYYTVAVLESGLIVPARALARIETAE